MALHVRPARPGDPAAVLLHESARSYYAAYAGGEARAERLLEWIYPYGGHSASFDVSLVAESAGAVVGVLAGFRSEHVGAYSRRFVALSLRRLPPAAWPGMTRHLRAAAQVSPSAPDGCWYVDALAVAPAWRRRGVAGLLLEAAERTAASAGRDTLVLDTGLENEVARRLYEGRGFRPRCETHAPDEETARVLGGRGFVSYVKAVTREQAT